MSRSIAQAAQPVERFFEFSVLGLLASGYLAVAGSGYLDLPTTAATGLALLLRALMVAGVVRIELSARLVTYLTLAYIAFYPIDYLYISGDFLTATVHLIFYLAIMKVLTARTNRDFFFVKLIAFLELLAAAVLSSSVNFFVFLGLFLLSGVCTFASSEIRRSTQLPRRVSQAGRSRFHLRLAVLSLTTAFGILVLTGGLFFLLPRTARAAFRHLIPQRYHTTGFSNEVELGDVGELRRTSTPVMHVRIDNIEHGLPLKWRGAALTQFDGRRWFNPPQSRLALKREESFVRLADPQQQRRKGARISYEVWLEALDSDALFFAGVPEFLRINLPVIYKLPTDSYRTGLGYGEGVRYFAYSYLPQEFLGTTYETEPLPEPIRREYLQLPRVDPRVDSLRREVLGLEKNDFERARKLESFLRTKFGYGLEGLERDVPDPLAHFLFEARRGHCEYFASAMAVMLRQSGIPARVATGFQSGTYNPLTGAHVIRTSDAHSWVEAYLEQRGWYTFDPTPPDPRPAGASLWARIGLLTDAASVFWNDWVLNYNRERQYDLASRLDSSGRSIRTSWAERWGASLLRSRDAALQYAKDYGVPALWIATLICAGAVLWLQGRAWVLARRQTQRLSRGEVTPHDATLLYARMLRILHRRGFEKPPWFTPGEFVAMLPAGPELPIVEDLTSAYNDLRYGGRPGAGARMLELLAALETSPQSIVRHN